MFKKTVLCTLLFCFLVSFSYAQTRVKVRNVAEFVKAINSNTIIEMEYGLYDLTEYGTIGEYGVSEGFLIANISNLTIKGVGKYPAELVVEDEYAAVLLFKNCTNIQLDFVEIGHGASKGYCMGSVIRFEGGEGLHVNRSILYGSGTYGIESSNTENITMTQSTVRSCTYGAISMINTQSVIFSSTYFTDNSSYDIFYFMNCNSVVFNDCIIKDNRNTDLNVDKQYAQNKLFAIEGSGNITLNNCLIKFNSTDYFASKSGIILNKGSMIEYNRFRIGDFQY
ncbi:MAG: right-handed parallel beta-helix repeat-containing protein [Bernardetiaceae bacterium]|nr:right-handed parallel beta-helix repeat-containing protein [Bernardetiaceae bacterium]